jgi:hypothetical protein
MELPDGSALREQLGPSEHLLWNGQPLGGVRLRRSDIFMVPFSFLWGGFASFWEWSVIHSNAPFFFRLWGVPFVLVGLYIIAGRFFWDAYQRGNTHYGITNERILIVKRGVASSVKSLNLRTLADVTLSAGSNGVGSIHFGSAGGFGAPAWLAQSGWPGASSAVPVFDLVENAKQVYDTIRRAQKAAS